MILQYLCLIRYQCLCNMHQDLFEDVARKRRRHLKKLTQQPAVFITDITWKSWTPMNFLHMHLYHHFCLLSKHRSKEEINNTGVVQNIRQYPVASSFTSITLGMTFFKCSIYLQHFSSVTVAQNDCMPCKSSSLSLGLAVVRMKCFISCHRFSIRFKSGLSGGVFSTLILFAWKNLCCFRGVARGIVLSEPAIW